MTSVEKRLPEIVAGVERKWWVLLAVGIGAFMSALDGSVVNTILPVIRDNFNSNVATIEWVVVVYLLVVSGLLLTFGGSATCEDTNRSISPVSPPSSSLPLCAVWPPAQRSSWLFAVYKPLGRPFCWPIRLPFSPRTSRLASAAGLSVCKGQ